MKKTNTVEFTKNVLLIIMLVICAYFFIKDINKTPEIRLTTNELRVVELSEKAQNEIYNKLNEIKFDENVYITDLEEVYGGITLQITYQEKDVLYKWEFDGQVIVYTVYPNEPYTEERYYKLDENSEMFAYLTEFKK